MRIPDYFVEVFGGDAYEKDGKLYAVFIYLEKIYDRLEREVM